jgi:hypothetical protein
MSISLRGLFGRQGIAGEVISLRNSLANHPQEMHRGSLREAQRRLKELASGRGLSRGCRRLGDIKIDFGVGEKDVGIVLPSWVPVADFAGETRTLEGVLVKSKITYEDFPFKPWHTYYDWNFFVRVDPQYIYLKSISNDRDDGLIECEWDTAFLPAWTWPQDGDRIWMVGRWIYDCGHADANGHKTEIHPPKAVASFRTEAVDLPGNAGPTRANSAKLYIGQKGGYLDQPINNQDYAFDLYLPPKPFADAKPVSKVVPKTPPLPAGREPKIAPFPADNPRALRVVIPLRGAASSVEEYGAIIYGGWSDPQGTEAAKVKRFRVTVEEIFMDANLDPSTLFDPSGNDEWYVYVGINGRWRIFESLNGDAHKLNYSVELDLAPTDEIRITACGFEADEVHTLMGKSIGVSWADVSDKSRGGDNAGKIRDGFLSLGLSLDPGIENEALNTLTRVHPPGALQPVTVASPKEEVGHYRLRYRIDVI